MQFNSWYYILILILIPVLHRWWLKRNEPAKVIFPIPVTKKLKSTNPLKWLFIVKYIGFVFLIIALARPQASYRQFERKVSGLDIVMVLDVSASMNIEDLADRSRLEVAKDTVRDFIRGRESDRIGLISFSGEPFTLAPPTLDYGLLIKAIRDVRIGVLKDGTAIGDGLSLAVNRLKDSKSKSKVVILLTDGDNNVGQIDPATAGDLAQGYGVKVYTIAIGREGRVKMPIKHRTALGNVVTSYQWFNNALNPELLKHIAKITDGKFYRATDAKTLQKVFSEINQLEKTEVQAVEKVRYQEKFEQPLKLGAFFLFLEKILATGWWRLLI